MSLEKEMCLIPQHMEGGAVVRFEGNVVMNLIMDNPTPGAESDASANPSVAPEPAAVPPRARSNSGKPANPK